MITMKDYTIVQTGHRQGLTVSAIAVKLGKDRKTVRKYLRMDQDQFIRYLERMAERGKAFAAYKDEILEIYRNHEGRTVYSSSVHDYLSDKYGELPGSDRTLRNYLTYLKASGAIGTDPGREYRPVEPLAYGKQAQIDFGVETTNIGKVWFVVVVLSRSRYRYVAAQSRPFASNDVISHLLDAFDFFGGIPEELVLDQDRTMIVAENLGDLATTRAFADFVAEQGLRLHVCRAADPESKGKVENAVKYVKTNYFSSRSFATFDELQAGMRKWLLRVNAKLSQATRLMPLADFEAHEKPALRPQRASIFRADSSSGSRESRKVDQKSLISVAATRYSVPSSYRLKEVEIERRDGLVLIFDAKTGTQIAAHREATTPGLTVVDKGHYRDREASQETLRADLVATVSDLPEWTCFVDGIYTEYRRYFREHAARLRKLLERNIDREKLTQALKFCLDHGLASAQDLIDAVDSTTPVLPVRTSPYRGMHRSRELPVVATRSLGEYQRFFDAAADKQGHKE
jgi:transposase